MFRSPRRCERGAIVAIVGALLLVLAACGGDDSDDAASDGDGLSGALRVFAASSMTEVFEELEATFEADNPDVDVQLVFDGSSALATQINEGASADVFASADTSNYEAVEEQGNVGTPMIFATNVLEIAVEAGNPLGIDGLADLGGDVLLVLCDPAVPCGRLAVEALEHAGVEAEPVSLEENVKAVLTKVTLGEADAGIVYVTDVRAAGDDLSGVVIPEADNVVTEYPIGIVTDTANPDAAQAWIDLLRSEEGQAALTGAGFGT